MPDDDASKAAEIRSLDTERQKLQAAKTIVAIGYPLFGLPFGLAGLVFFIGGCLGHPMSNKQSAISLAVGLLGIVLFGSAVWRGRTKVAELNAQLAAIDDRLARLRAELGTPSQTN